MINVKQFAKFVVDLAESVAPTDIEEGMRVGVDRNKYQIHIPLPPKIDPTVTMMQVSSRCSQYSVPYSDEIKSSVLCDFQRNQFAENWTDCIDRCI